MSRVIFFFLHSDPIIMECPEDQWPHFPDKVKEIPLAYNEGCWSKMRRIPELKNGKYQWDYDWYLIPRKDNGDPQRVPKKFLLQALLLS